MKSRLYLQQFLRALGLPAMALVALTSAFAAPTDIFYTQFESGQGYSTNLDLVGQAGWLGDGSGGNGIVNNFIAGQGQQAYIGYSAPAAGDDQLVAWQPLNFSPLAANQPIVKFSVLMSIEDSTNDNFDNFRWSVYNRSGGAVVLPRLRQLLHQRKLSPGWHERTRCDRCFLRPRIELHVARHHELRCQSLERHA